MKIEVPFLKQESNNSCGISAMRMILQYLGQNYTEEELYQECSPEKSGVIWTVDLARLGKKKGFETEFYTRSLHLNQRNQSLEFYQKLTAESTAAQRVDQIVSEAEKIGVKLFEQPLSLNDIKSKMEDGWLAVILLDWRVVSPKENQFDFQGHLVPIVGFNDDSFFVHNQGMSDPLPFYEIKKETFEKARKSKGTDEDIVFVKKKK